MSVVEEDLENLATNPEQLLSWDLTFFKELDEWQSTLGKQNEQVGEKAFKIAFDLLSPELINTHAATILQIPVFGATHLDEWNVVSRIAGGYGVVCKVEDRNNPGSWMAVKYLKESPADVKRQCIRFVREARIWRSLVHENIVPLIGIWINCNEHGAPLPAFVSPWMDGGSLFHFLRTEMGMQTSMNTRMKMLLDVLGALQYMHNLENVVSHGDLSSSNILLGNGRVFICDFGLSRVEDGTRGLTTSLTRNIRWIAPERLSISPNYVKVPNPKSDMFEFGVTFWETITCETPWDGASPIKKRFVDHEQLPQPANMPPVVWDLIQMCLRDNPQDRITAGMAFPILQQFVNTGVDW